MSDRLVAVADGFWNIRGSHKALGLLEVGTQSSLVRLSSGAFAMLDAYAFDDHVARELEEITGGFDNVEAILNLHPFHTVHVRDAAAMFPKARLYGTQRHAELAPELQWEPERTNEPALHALFSRDFTFSVPRGVEFASKDHFASVLAFHPSSRTLHVDDTLMWTNLPLLGGLRFHLGLRAALQQRVSAAAEFRAWATGLIEHCHDVDHLCTAHLRPLPDVAHTKTSVADHVRAALARCEQTLLRHERHWG